MQIDKKIYNDINEYCKLNGLKTRDFIHKILKEGFLKEKYGDKPFFMQEEKIEIGKTNKTEEILETKQEETTEIKQEPLERLDTVLKVVEKTSFNITPIKPNNNMDIGIQIPETWFKVKENEEENTKPIVKKKRKLK